LTKGQSKITSALPEEIEKILLGGLIPATIYQGKALPVEVPFLCYVGNQAGCVYVCFIYMKALRGLSCR